MSAQIIQAQYEQLDEIVRRFQTQADLSSELQQSIRSHVDALNGEWIGEGSHAFFREMEEEIFPTLNRLTNAFEQSSITTHQIIQILQNAEEDAANQIHVESDESISPGNFISTIGNIVGYAGDGYNVVEGINSIYDFYTRFDQLDSLGEFLTQRGSLAESMLDPLTSHVGQVGLVLNVAGAGFEIYGDLAAGQGLAEVFVSEGVEFGAEYVIRAAAYSNPISAGVLVVWDGTALVGDLTGWYDVPSLGDTTDLIGDAVYDAGDAVIEFGGGLIDSGTDIMRGGLDVFTF